MSRIGKQPVVIPTGVSVTVSGPQVSAKGPQGELSLPVPTGMTVNVEEGRVTVGRREETRQARSLHGLTRSLIANMVKGVSQGFRKDLEIQGVGFRAQVQAGKLVMSLGFSAPAVYAIPQGVKVTVEGGTSIAVAGPDSQQVGNAAARIRGFFPAEPYKGKGVRYKGEHVRRKVGKTVA